MNPELSPLNKEPIPKYPEDEREPNSFLDDGEEGLSDFDTKEEVQVIVAEQQERLNDVREELESLISDAEKLDPKQIEFNTYRYENPKKYFVVLGSLQIDTGGFGGQESIRDRRVLESLVQDESLSARFHLAPKTVDTRQLEHNDVSTESLTAQSEQGKLEAKIIILNNLLQYYDLYTQNSELWQPEDSEKKFQLPRYMYERTNKKMAGFMEHIVKAQVLDNTIDLEESVKNSTGERKKGNFIQNMKLDKRRARHDKPFMFIDWNNVSEDSVKLWKEKLSTYQEKLSLLLKKSEN